MPNIDDLFSDPNGSAFEACETRVGVPLDYVAEKVRSSIESLHVVIGGTRAHDSVISELTATDHAFGHAALLGAFMYALMAFLALHNMLGLAKNPDQLMKRLAGYSRSELRDWLDGVERGGSVVE